MCCEVSQRCDATQRNTCWPFREGKISVVTGEVTSCVNGNSITEEQLSPLLMKLSFICLQLIVHHRASSCISRHCVFLSASNRAAQAWKLPETQINQPPTNAYSQWAGGEGVNHSRAFLRSLLRMDCSWRSHRYHAPSHKQHSHPTWIRSRLSAALINIHHNNKLFNYVKDYWRRLSVPRRRSSS